MVIQYTVYKPYSGCRHVTGLLFSQFVQKLVTGKCIISVNPLNCIMSGFYILFVFLPVYFLDARFLMITLSIYR